MASSENGNSSDSESPCMQKFRLYETRSMFYMIGRDKSRTHWRVLKIDRLDPLELNIREDSTTYTERECSELLRRIHEGNLATGGLKFVTTCYGIVGFIKFLGPYYMLIITKRRRIGAICGHNVYAVSKCEMIPLPNSSVQSSITNSKNENRYKKLLCTVDLTKDFFFSYSYHIMRSLQKNLYDNQTGQVVYETMFVWNEFLTRGIRNHLQNTLWTVALVYGFFKQATLSVSGRDFKLTLIARRSRHYAGTRYLKRGVNEKGRVANDVETEQIVFEEVREVSKKDQNYEATRLHFENLAKRYGNPIIILNLIKTQEKKPRESILRQEFANAIDFINKDSSEENRLRFLHWDLHKHSRRNVNNGNLSPQNHCSNDIEDADKLERNLSGDKNVANGNHPIRLPMLQKGVLRTNCIDCLDRTNVAQYAYGLAALGRQLHALGVIDNPKIDLDAPLADDLMGFYERMGDTLAHQYGGSAAHNKIFSERRGQWRAATQSQEFFRTLQRYYSNAYMDAEKQDAINVFLGHFQPQQDKPALWELDSDQHYGMGRNGQTNVDEDGRSFFKRSLSDGNILHETGSAMSATNVNEEKFSSSGLPNQLRNRNNVLSESSPEISTSESDVAFSRYTPSMPRRQLFGDVQRDRYFESDHIYEHGDASSSSNFVDLDWLSSSGNSCEEEPYERSSLLTSSPIAGLSMENVNGIMGEPTPSTSEYGSGMKVREQTGTGTELSYDDAQISNVPEGFSDTFVRWVEKLLCVKEHGNFP
ncbi:phosphoinositide phosphatase SAC3 [Citrus sinensis]|uniref:Phosphoinositide phosphatase SAC3 n=1 Tax=Citrus sinensis TaxID=2711 RepID=A0ACB8P4C7_CITSI|nr:phosphoinositide phosphatase SAC3 [Citrus sinensis]